MYKRKLIFYLFPAIFIVCILISLLPVAVLLTHLEQKELKEAKDTLAFETLLIQQSLQQVSDLTNRQLKNLIPLRTKRGETPRWITFFDNEGNVLYDSMAGRTADNSGVWQVLEGKRPVITRKERVNGRQFFCLISPICQNGQVRGVLKVAMDMNNWSILSFESLRFFVGTLSLVLFLSFLLAAYLARRIVGSLNEITTWALKAGSVDDGTRLERRIPSEREWQFEELILLKTVFSELTGKILKRFFRLETDLKELRLLFMNMKEAVFLLDAEKRIATMNRAAEEVVQMGENVARGMPFNAVLRDICLKIFIDSVFLELADMETEITLHAGGSGFEKRIFFVRAVVLRKEEPAGIFGILLVMEDMTVLRRLEAVRNDFVANVSHELKTPITVIKGYIETLLDGGPPKWETARNFLEIVMRQSDRLEALVEDILLLSRTEEKPDGRQLELRKTCTCSLIEAVTDACRIRAEKRCIRLKAICGGEPIPEIMMDERLMEQAVTNLVVNAINYSPKGGSVLIKAEQRGEDLLISVQDSGPGISPEHLDRIFERFYRVDKARSRRLGGTGLGLAIVKHIVQSHGGRVDVNSRPGEGSTFSIILSYGHGAG